MYTKLTKGIVATVVLLVATLFTTATAQATSIGSASDGSAPIEIKAISDCTTFRIIAAPQGSSSGGGSNWTGHAFLIVNNDFTSTFTVAGLTIPVGGQVTIGTWGNLSKSNGVYLNYEAYQGASNYTGRVSLSACITKSQLTTLNSQISSNNAWTLTNNCSSFASKVWNAVVTNNQVSAGAIHTPANLSNSIKSKSPFYTNTAFSSASSSNVWRLQTNGSLILV